MFENINRELLPIKAHYFLFNAGKYVIFEVYNCKLYNIMFNCILYISATGPIVPFLPTIAKQLGFSGILVGTIYTILPVSGLVAKPLFGGLADKFKIHKPLFLLFQAVVAIAMFTILFIPEVDRSANVALNCKGEASLEICSKNGFSNKVIHNVISEKMHINTSCHVSCKATKDIYTELCLHWEASEFCELANSNNSDTDTFDFNVIFDIFHDFDVSIYILCYICCKSKKNNNGTLFYR